MDSKYIGILRLFLIFSLALISCGKKGGTSSSGGAIDPQSEARLSTSIQNPAGNRQTVDIEILVSDSLGLISNQVELGLASAGDFSLDIDDCVSGYVQKEIVAASPMVTLYKGDQNCLAKLRSITVGEKKYTASFPGSVDFTSFLEGDTATFTDFGGAKLELKIQSTLGSPVTGDEVISVSFHEVNSPIESTENLPIGEPYSISMGGEEAPSLSIAQVLFNGVTSAGEGRFAIKMECEVPVVNSGVDTACHDQVLVNMKYALVEDTFNSVMTLADASSVITASGIPVTEPALLSLGSDGQVPNGGFQTVEIVGSKSLQNLRHMILVISISDTSYRYINLDLDDL